MRKDCQKNVAQVDLRSDLANLQALIKDEQCLTELTKKLNEFNVFDVLKSAHHEIRHSNVLAWLLNPYESHMIGRQFFDSLVRQLPVAADHDFLVTTYIDDDAEVKVSTEVMGIDILVEVQSEKFAIALENKVWSKEHDSQLPRYRKILESVYKDEDGWRRYYFYLTVEGDSSKDDSEYWKSVSYHAVLGAIRDVISIMDSSNQAKQFVQQYCSMLERKIMNQSDIEELCWKIYRRHAKALNQIFEIVGQGGSPLQSLIENVLQELEKEGKIIICKDKGGYVKPAFHTKALDEYFGSKQGGLGSWGNNYLYVLWFERRDMSKVKLFFEVGPFQATDIEAAKISAMANAVNFKRILSGRFCRVWHYGRTFNAQEGSDMDKLSDWVKHGVEEVLRQEKFWIEKASKKLREI